jgi:hypothetical protein
VRRRGRSTLHPVQKRRDGKMEFCLRLSSAGSLRNIPESLNLLSLSVLFSFMLQFFHMHAAQGGNTAGLLWEIGGDVLRFPAWWYGKGMLRAVKYTSGIVAGYARTLGLFVWVKNIFTPMFGRYDWQSRCISIFMRLVNVVGRGIAVCMLTVLTVLLFFAYIALPAVAVLFVLYHATALFAV